MLTKEKIIEAIQNMSEPFSVDDVLQRIVFLADVEEGIRQSEKGETFSTSEAKEKLSKWSTSGGQQNP